MVVLSSHRGTTCGPKSLDRSMSEGGQRYVTAATPSRPAPSTMAPSHPRPNPTPQVGSVSVDVIRLAIRNAIAPRRRRARLARFLSASFLTFYLLLTYLLTRGASNQRHASTRTRRADASMVWAFEPHGSRL